MIQQISRRSDRLLIAGLLALTYAYGVALMLGMTALAVWIASLSPVLIGVGIAVVAPMAWAVLVTMLPATVPDEEMYVIADQRSQLRLISELRAVESALGIEHPSHLHLTLGTEAQIGLRGKESVPTLTLGLALIYGSTIGQLRAILVHESAHVSSGQLKHLAAINRLDLASTRMADRIGMWWLIGFIFAQPLALIVKASSKLSRRHEAEVDRMVAETMGDRARVEGLRQLVAVQLFYDDFWSVHIVPLLDLGYLPPVLSGFQEAFAVADRDQLNQDVDRLIEHEEFDSLDSHPLLRHRLAPKVDAVRPLLNNPPRPASALIQGGDRLAEQLLIEKRHELSPVPLKKIEWAAVGEEVFVPHWRDELARLSPQRQPILVLELPDMLLSRESSVGASNEQNAPNDVAADQSNPAIDARVSRRVRQVIGALQVALADNGWRVSISAGKMGAATRGDQTIEPPSIVWDLVEGRMSVQEWRDFWVSHDLAGLVLFNQLPSDTRTLKTEGVLQQAEQFKLYRSRVNLIALAIGLMIVGTIGLLIVGLCVWAVVDLDVGVVGKLLFGALGVFLFALIAHSGWRMIQEVRGEGMVEIGPDDVTFSLRQMLREPMMVARDQVKVAAVDLGTDPAATMFKRRFPVYPYDRSPYASEEPTGWLWIGASVAPIPMLMMAKTTPNCVFIFDPPVAAPKVRRNVPHGIRRGKLVRALFVRVDQPLALREVIMRWEVGGRVVQSDIDLIEGGLQDAKNDQAT